MSIYRIGIKNGIPVVYVGERLLKGEEADWVLAIFFKNGGNAEEQEKKYRESLIEGREIAQKWLKENTHLFLSQ